MTMSKSSAAVTVQVPATTSNLGPGFDTLGIALRLYNRVRLRPAPGRLITLTSPIAEEARAGASAMIREAADLFFRRTRRRRIGFAIELDGEIPVARGLGSSVTVRLGVLAALGALTGVALPRPVLLDLVTELEHHPDNAAPAIYGGFAVAGRVGRSVRCVRFPVPRATRFVALIPRFEIRTDAARRLLPDLFSRADTVHNLNRVALISAAFAGGHLEALRGLFEDRVHQPYRQQLIPQLPGVLRAGEQAGAVGGWLSGSGSTIMCLATRRAAAVGRAMRGVLPQSDLKILAPDNSGFRVVR
jgi:homoserine kinase